MSDITVNERKLMLSRRIAGGALAAGSLALALVAASPASAAATKVWVQSGSSTSGTVTFTAKNTNVFRLADLRSGGFFDCPIGAVTIGGTVTLGTARPVSQTATITSTTFTEGSCKFSGLNVRVAGAASASAPWYLNAPNNSSPNTTPPSNGQTTVGNISNVLATTVTVNPSTSSGAPGASDCSITFGNGVNSGNSNGSPGTISPVTYTNAATPTISILTTGTAASATIGVNRAYTGPLPGTTKAAGTGCAANALQAGDKAQIRSSASATTPATFSVTNSGSGPLWVAAT